MIGQPSDSTEIKAALLEPANDPLDEAALVDEPWLGRLATTDGLYVTDERQRVRAWSNSAQRMLGYAPEEVLGQLCYAAVARRRPEGHPVCGLGCPVTRNARRGRGTAPFEIAAMSKDGTPRYLTTSVLVVQGQHGAFRVIHMMREFCDRPPSRPAKEPATTEGPFAEVLTRRELEVLRLFARGKCLDEVASELSISVITARNHSTSIEHKLGVRNRLLMVLEGMRRGLV